MNKRRDKQNSIPPRSWSSLVHWWILAFFGWSVVNDLEKPGPHIGNLIDHFMASIYIFLWWFLSRHNINPPKASKTKHARPSETPKHHCFGPLWPPPPRLSGWVTHQTWDQCFLVLPFAPTEKLLLPFFLHNSCDTAWVLVPLAPLGLGGILLFWARKNDMWQTQSMVHINTQCS